MVDSEDHKPEKRSECKETVAIFRIKQKCKQTKELFFMLSWSLYFSVYVKEDDANTLTVRSS